jgi:hypothetical protein
MTTYDLMIWNVVMFCSVCLIVAIVLVLIIREKTLYPLNEERIIIVEKIKKPETVNNNNQDIYSVIDTYV